MKKRITKIDGKILIQGGDPNKENLIKEHELLVKTDDGKITLTNKDKEIVSQGEHSDEDYEDLQDKYDAIKDLPKLVSVETKALQASISNTDEITSETYNYSTEFNMFFTQETWDMFLSGSIQALREGEMTDVEFLEYLSTHIGIHISLNSKYNNSLRRATFECLDIYPNYV